MIPSIISFISNIFSDGQDKVIRSKAKYLISPATHDAKTRLIRAVEFELITDNECWLRGSGELTVRMLILVDQLNYIGQPQEIRVYSTNNAFFDLDAISERLAGILSEYLQSYEIIALDLFSGGIKRNMMANWKSQAAQWLIDDISVDTNIFEYLQCRPVEGRKIIIENAFGRTPIELEIKFEQGLCQFDVLVDQFIAKTTALYDNLVIFTHPQQASAKRAITTVVVETFRDPNFSHPYSDHAIECVLEMKKDIRDYAGELGISPLALAGVLADEYEKDLAPKLKKADDDLERFLIAVVTRNYDNIDFSLSVYLSIFAQIVKKGSAYLELVDIYWTLLPKHQKKSLLTTGAIAVKRSLTDQTKAILTGLTEAHDYLSDLDLRLRLNTEAFQEDLKNFNPDQCGQDLKEYAIREGLLNLIKFCYAIKYGGGQESIKNRAAEIQVHLDHAKQPPERV